MFTLICFLLVIIGCINWLCIGLLQYDFVAGLFGSQANVFSRVVYAIIGIASLVLIYAAVRTKGCIKCNGKRSSDQELKLIRKKDKRQDNNQAEINNNTAVSGNNQSQEQPAPPAQPQMQTADTGSSPLAGNNTNNKVKNTLSQENYQNNPPQRTAPQSSSENNNQINN